MTLFPLRATTISCFSYVAEHGPAAGIGPVKEREHAVARQAKQVHGRVTAAVPRSHRT
jgi:hypothetical protein